METAARYAAFADQEARGVSPLYFEWAHRVAQDRAMLEYLDGLPEQKRQPNLLFGAVKYLAGVLPDYETFRRLVLAEDSPVGEVMLTRTTQTNEPGRCAVLLPALAALPQPIALLELGAAAGLCLIPDRYRYDYDGTQVGPEASPVLLRCRVSGPVPIPDAAPRVVWRRGIDLNPLDVTAADTAAWLAALVWPGDDDREARLLAALRLASTDPPPVERGDITQGFHQLARSAPDGATLVVYHSAVMPYLSREERSRLVAAISRLGATWISFEARGVVPGTDPPPAASADEENAFVLARHGVPLALASPHGRWMRWIA